MLNFNIKYILVDFSLAQLNALKNTFQVPIFGCYFHFIKCITKKINSYLEDKNRREIILENLKVGITSKQKFDHIKFFSRYEVPVKFSKYFISTWIKRYDQKLWDFYYRDRLMIQYSSNNFQEREFLSLKLSIGIRNPIDKLIGALFLYIKTKTSETMISKVSK